MVLRYGVGDLVQGGFVLVEWVGIRKRSEQKMRKAERQGGGAGRERTIDA